MNFFPKELLLKVLPIYVNSGINSLSFRCLCRIIDTLQDRCNSLLPNHNLMFSTTIELKTVQVQMTNLC